VKKRYTVTRGDFRLGRERIAAGSTVELDPTDYIVSLHVADGTFVEQKPEPATKAKKE
jgi:hypothetical protein